MSYGEKREKENKLLSGTYRGSDPGMTPSTLSLRVLFTSNFITIENFNFFKSCNKACYLNLVGIQVELELINPGSGLLHEFINPGSGLLNLVKLYPPLQLA